MFDRTIAIESLLPNGLKPLFDRFHERGADDCTKWSAGRQALPRQIEPWTNQRAMGISQQGGKIRLIFDNFDPSGQGQPRGKQRPFNEQVATAVDAAF